MRLTKERINLAREFLRQYGTLDARCSQVDWLMLKFSCSREVAERLYAAATKETT